MEYIFLAREMDIYNTSCNLIPDFPSFASYLHFPFSLFLPVSFSGRFVEENVGVGLRQTDLCHWSLVPPLFLSVPRSWRWAWGTTIWPNPWEQGPHTGGMEGSEENLHIENKNFLGRIMLLPRPCVNLLWLIDFFYLPAHSLSTELVFEEVNSFKAPDNQTDSLQAEQ